MPREVMRKGEAGKWDWKKKRRQNNLEILNALTV